MTSPLVDLTLAKNPVELKNLPQDFPYLSDSDIVNKTSLVNRELPKSDRFHELNPKFGGIGTRRKFRYCTPRCHSF